MNEDIEELERLRKLEKELKESGLQGKDIESLARLKGITPSMLALSILRSEREIERQALRMSLSEQDSASIIAGKPVLGTLGNKEAGIEAGAPLETQNLMAYNTVRESIFMLASWKKSASDFYEWQNRRRDNWSIVSDLTELLDALPLNYEKEEHKDVKKRICEILATNSGLTKILGEEFGASSELDLMAYRTRIDELIQERIGVTLEDEFDINSSEVDEDYIQYNCPILWRILQFAVRTIIFRSRSLQMRGFEAQELGAVTKSERDTKKDKTSVRLLRILEEEQYDESEDKE